MSKYPLLAGMNHGDIRKLIAPRWIDAARRFALEPVQRLSATYRARLSGLLPEWLPWDGFIRLDAEPQAPETPETEEEAELAALLVKVNALPGGQRAAMAGSIGVLWEAFCTKFGGVSAFLSADPAAQKAFIDSLEAARDRMKPGADSEKGYIYYAVAVFLNYIKAMLLDARTGAWRELGELAAALISQARLLPAPAAITRKGPAE